MFIHETLAIGALYVTVPVLEKMNEVVTVEIIESIPESTLETVAEQTPPTPIQNEIAKGEEVAPTLGAQSNAQLAPSSKAIATPSKPATLSAPKATAPMHALDSDVVSAPATKIKAKALAAEPQMTSLKTATSGGQAAVATSAPSRAGVPETLEDIAAPDLDMDSVNVQQVGSLGEDAFENEFKNIDSKSDAAIRAQKSAMDEEAKMIADEQERALMALEEDNQNQARLMQDSLQTTRTKNAALVAQIKASEQAAAERAAQLAAAQAKAERDAQAEADAKAARVAAEKAARENGLGTGAQGKGRDSVGQNQAALAANGAPTGVRALESLRQMPGNPKPQYSVDERFRREQGRVIFQAYVTPEGRLTSFKLLESTGYKNLDGKTLAALKKWKFYPGQEGWVEIPQLWNLKGDVEQMPTLLRRQVTQK